MGTARPALYVAITNHGFGHATRTASVVAAIQERCPEILVILVTTAPRWLLESYIQGDFILRPRAFDIGVIQSDSLTMDKAATLEKLIEIRSHQNAILAAEVSFIQQNQVGLILADIPPLATHIAKAARVPCWMVSNFGWDFIYRPWDGEFAAMADWISECFSQCDRLFRLPFHEPMAAFPSITDVGFIGGSPRYRLEQLQAQFALKAPVEKTVLLTFGGLNLQQIPYEGLKRFSDWQFITFDPQAPDLPNLCKVLDRQYRPVDFMPLCGKVVSKPGYGTFAEAYRVGTSVVSLSREDFAEAHILLQGLQDYTEHFIVSPAEFYQGTWDFLEQPMLPPRQSQVLTKDGNETIAQAVIEYFSER